MRQRLLYHPLARKKAITIDDLDGESIVMYARGITRADDRLRDYLLRHVPDVDIVDVTAYNSSLALKCELTSSLLIYYSMYWEDLKPLTAVPLDIGMEFPIDIGLGCKADHSDAVEKFLSVAGEVYRNGSDRH